MDMIDREADGSDSLEVYAVDENVLYFTVLFVLYCTVLADAVGILKIARVMIALPVPCQDLFNSTTLRRSPNQWNRCGMLFCWQFSCGVLASSTMVRVTIFHTFDVSNPSSKLEVLMQFEY